MKGHPRGGGDEWNWWETEKDVQGIPGCSGGEAEQS